MRGRILVGKNVVGIWIGILIPVGEANFGDKVGGRGSVLTVLANGRTGATKVRLDGIGCIDHGEGSGSAGGSGVRVGCLRGWGAGARNREGCRAAAQRVEELAGTVNVDFVSVSVSERLSG